MSDEWAETAERRRKSFVDEERAGEERRQQLYTKRATIG
jgi:hypothetical protein